jgi:hypothetical protein
MKPWKSETQRKDLNHTISKSDAKERTIAG